MSAALLAGLSVPVVVVLSVLATPLVLWWERRRSVREPNPLQAWRSMSAAAQEAHDTAVLDAAEAAEMAAARAAEAARRNALFHP
jgi:hypothetical protein